MTCLSLVVIFALVIAGIVFAVWAGSEGSDPFNGIF